MSERIQGGAHDPRTHDSARRHVTGEALYIDDLPEPAGLLHVQLGLSTKAHGKIVNVDLSQVRAAPGVAYVLTAKGMVVRCVSTRGCGHACPWAGAAPTAPPPSY